MVMNNIHILRIKAEYEKAYEHLLPENLRKLSLIFEHWLNEFLIARREGYSLPPNCIEIFSAINSQVGNNFAPRNMRERSNLKSAVFFALQFLPQSEGIVVGGKISSRDDVKMLITASKLQNIRWRVDSVKREKFFERLAYFLTDHLLSELNYVMPDVFFSKIVYHPVSLPKIIRGSPTIFNQKDYCKIFFTKQPIKIIGLVHGGCYGEFRNNVIEELEESLSNKYLHWGFGSLNVKQNRYPEIVPETKFVNSVIWVGRLPSNCFVEYYFKGYRQIMEDLTSKLVGDFQKISRILPVTYMEHPRQEVVEKYFDCQKKFADLTDLELSKSVFVIDAPGSSFLFQAIYQNLPFLLLFSREWRDYLSTRYLQFLEFLESLNLVIYCDANDDYVSVFQKISEGVIYQADLFQKCRDWLECNFVDE